MGRYIADQNATGFFYESGLYATASGTQHWIGQVQEHTIEEELNTQQIRYTGGGTRNVNQQTNTAEDFTGTFSYFPQDWKFLMFALGSNVDGGSPSPFTHTISETNSSDGNAFTSGTKNPFMSFGLEDSQKGSVDGLNFIRTVKGAVVDSLSISASQGEILEVEVEYTAQHVAFSSGAVTALTATTTRPFLWSDTQVHLPSGTTLDCVTDFSFSLNNNLEPPHYLNGSKVIDVPIPQNREYEVELTLHGNSDTTKSLYDQYFRGGSVFNMMLSINADTGSRDMFMVLSGCKLTNMEAPSNNEEVNEQTITIVPETASAIVNDQIQLYNPW